MYVQFTCSFQRWIFLINTPSWEKTQAPGAQVHPRFHLSLLRSPILRCLSQFNVIVQRWSLTVAPSQ
jgi:hypothetical protein